MGTIERTEEISQERTFEDAITGLALCAAAADGKIHEDDLSRIATTLSRTRALRAWSPGALRERLIEMHGRASREGTDTLLARSADAVPARLGATVFAITAELLFETGDVSPPEEVFLERAQASLGVPHDTAGVVMEALAIKSRT